MPSLSLNRRLANKSSLSTLASKPGVDAEKPAIHDIGHTGLDHFPGGDAMLEVLTRLQSLQDSFYTQLQV